MKAVFFILFKYYILNVVRTYIRKMFYDFITILRICKKIFGEGNIVSGDRDMIFLSIRI